MFGSKKGSLNELKRGRRNVSTSSAVAKPLRISSRAMHSDPQISLHEIGSFLSSSVDAMIHRLSTDQLIRGGLPDKTWRLGRVCSKSFWLDKPSPSYEKGTMMKMRFVFSIGAIAAIVASCTNNPLGGSTAESAAERDYERSKGQS